MDKYRNKIKNRLLGMIGGVLIGSALISVGYYLSKNAGITLPDFISGFQVGLLCGAFGVLNLHHANHKRLGNLKTMFFIKVMGT